MDCQRFHADFRSVAAAAARGGRATTFNAAGVNPASVPAGSLSGIDQRVNAFRVRGEFLSTFQDSQSIVGMFMPDSNGVPYYLEGTGDPFSRHGRDSLFAGIDQL